MRGQDNILGSLTCSLSGLDTRACVYCSVGFNDVAMLPDWNKTRTK